jgi:hypothetical protein
MLINVRSNITQIQPMPRSLPNKILTPLPGVRIQRSPNRLRLIARHQTLTLTKWQIILPIHHIDRSPELLRLLHELRIRKKLTDGEGLFTRFTGNEDEGIEVRGAEKSELVPGNRVGDEVPVVEKREACRVVFTSDDEVEACEESRLACGIDAESREDYGA